MKNKTKKKRISRRGFLKGLGITAAGLTITYAVGRQYYPVLPSLSTPAFDDGTAWISIDPDGKIAMLSPVHEMGQGSSLGLAQIVAEELNVDVSAIVVRFPSTREVPHMRFTTGSRAISEHARPVAQAAARLREELRRRAAASVKLETAALTDRTGGFLTPDNRQISYAGLVDEGALVLASDNLPQADLYSFDENRNHRQIGRTARQIQAQEIVTGKPVFAGDIRKPGMAYGRCIQAPAPNARIVRIDSGGVADMPGVVAFVADQTNNMVGVVASTPGVLNRALERVVVEWDRPDPYTREDIDTLVDIDKALDRGKLEHAIVDEEIDQSTAWSIDMRFDQPILHHGAQEPRSAVVEFSHRDGQQVVDIWTGTQDMFMNQKKAAADLGWSEERVTVHAMRIGGGFGGRVLYDVVRDAVFLAKAVKQPVKVEWSRRDEFYADRTRPPSSHRVRIRLDRDRKISDWWHACVSGHVLLTELMAPEPLLSAMRFMLHDFGASRGLQSHYAAKSKRVEMSDIELPFHVGEWRSLGAAPNNFAIESAVDQLARNLQQDPVEFRLDNISEDQARLKTCLARVKAMCDERSHSSAFGFGRGFACGIYDELSFVAAAFDIRIDVEQRTVQIERCYCVLDVGLVISPDQVHAQIEGCAMMAIGQLLMEEAPIARGGLSAGQFSDYPTPTMMQVPEFELELVSNPAIAPAGVGQAPIVALVPALANAICDATGFRATSLPVHPDDLYGQQTSG